MTDTKSNSPFKSISENLPFWPDKENPNSEPFTGVLIDDSMVLGEDADPTKNVPVYVFAEIETGEKFFVIQSYAIKKAVEKVQATGAALNDIVFRFTFKGKSESKGKPYNQFDTAYCTTQEYQMAHEEQDATPDTPHEHTKKK